MTSGSPWKDPKPLPRGPDLAPWNPGSNVIQHHELHLWSQWYMSYWMTPKGWAHLLSPAQA